MRSLASSTGSGSDTLCNMPDLAVAPALPEVFGRRLPVQDYVELDDCVSTTLTRSTVTQMPLASEPALFHVLPYKS
jgi:hypothetical protein